MLIQTIEPKRSGEIVREKLAISGEKDYIINRLVRLVCGGVVLNETRWQLQEAKSKFSELVEKALNDGPQVVTKRGVDAVVVLSVEAYRALVEPKPHLADLFLSSPLRGVELNLDRDKDLGREVDL